MARSPVEIQADIAVTRRVIERQLDTLEGRLTRRGWTLPLVLSGAFLAGLVLARVPLAPVLRGVAGTVRAAAAVAGTVAALGGAAATVERARSERRHRRAA
jgi:hypothetical protein